jgi:signal transduction histidine kinase
VIWPWLLTTLTLLFEKLYDVRDAYLAGQTQERSRIRRDLHDQIGHKLLSLIYTAKDNYSRTLAQETMSQLSELIQALKQEPINLDDLAVRVHSVCEDSCSHANIQLEWANEILPGNTIKINSDQYLNILNIVRELLSNTSKHSGARKLSVAIGYGEGMLRLTYADDGSGFVQTEVKPGNGLFNLQLRAAELQAKMRWQTDTGTCVQIETPLASGESNHD